MSLDDLQITIAGVRFDRVCSDANADVLYLHVGDPSTATECDESPEGHHLRFDREGHMVGITLAGIRKDLEAGHSVTVTLPEPVEVGESELRRVIQAAEPAMTVASSASRPSPRYQSVTTMACSGQVPAAWSTFSSSSDGTSSMMALE